MPRIGRPCSCCSHPERDAIDRALIDPGAVMPVLSRRFAVSADALLRHRAAHLPRATRRAALEAFSEAEGFRGESLCDQAGALRDRALGILDRAEAAGDLSVAVRALREARECLVAIGRVTGEVQDPALTVNVSVLGSPAWIEVQATLIRALTPFPEARAAVTAAIARLAA